MLESIYKFFSWIWDLFRSGAARLAAGTSAVFAAIGTFYSVFNSLISQVGIAWVYVSNFLTSANPNGVVTDIKNESGNFFNFICYCFGIDVFINTITGLAGILISMFMFIVSIFAGVLTLVIAFWVWRWVSRLISWLSLGVSNVQ